MGDYKAIDQAKVLATCLAYIQKELREQESRLRKELDRPEVDFSPISESLQSLEEKYSETLKSLPEELVYDIHLKDAKDELRESFNSSMKTVLEDISSLSEDLDERYISVNSILSEISNEVDSQGKTLLSKVDFGKFYRESKQSLSDLSESLRKTEYGIEKSILDLSKSLDSTTTSLIENISDIESKLETSLKEEVTLREERDLLFQKQLKKIQGEFSLSINNTLVDIKKTSDVINKNIDSQIRNIETNVKFLEDKIYLELKDIKNSFKQKSDINHTHSEYANKEHTHADINRAIQVLDKDRNQTKTTIVSMYEEVRKIISELSKKANKSDLISLKDLDKYADTIQREIEKKIQTPKDGVDGKEWEFKFDPLKRGLLLFKRSDQTKWQSQNLLGPMQQAAPMYGGGGGGVFTESSGVQVQSFVSDLDGLEFNVSPVEHNFTTVISYRVFDSNSGEDVSLQTRKFEDTITVNSNIDMTGLSIEIIGTM